MCGFVAMQVREKISSFNEKILNNLNHRGPTGSSYENISLNGVDNGEFYFGHTRLAITGTSNGVQPIYSENKKCIALVNGEIYNWKELKKLIPDYRFSTLTDSEIIPALYSVMGVDFIKYIKGEYAFVIYDIEKNQWILVRDRMGTKPIHWTFFNKQFYVSSEAKALKNIIPLELDKDSLFFSQNFQYLPQGKSLFKNINLLEPGFMMIVSNNEVIYKNKFYEMPTTTKEKVGFSDAVKNVEKLMVSAVKSRIPSEVPFCAHLSGGIDSSSVCALAAKHGLKDVFTVSFVESEFHNELPLAKETANMLGLKLNVVELKQNQLLKSIEDAVYHAEGFCINGHLPATYLLNKEIAKAGFKVALSGQGSDEIFMGYSHLKKDYMDLNKLANPEFEKEISYISGFQLANGQSFELNEVKKLFGVVPSWINAKSSMAFKLSSLWSNDFNGSIEKIDKYFVNNFLSSVSSRNFDDYSLLHKNALAWIKYCFAGYILKILDDAQSMAHGIENRLPFLDEDLVDYSFSLPDEIYFEGTVEKHILRTIFKDKLPSSVINKTKQSFMSSPMVNSLLDKDNFDYVYDIINNSNFINQNLYDQTKLNQSLIQWRDNQNPSNEPLMMTILSLASFCKSYNL